MDKLTSFFTGLDEFRFSKGGNFVDRIFYKYTPLIMGFFGVILMALQFIGDFSIHCFCPAHFTDAMVEYTNRRCWTTVTYHVPMSSKMIPQDDKGREYIAYYQWVVAILFFQTILLNLPSQIWRSISNCSGYQISNIIAKASKYNKTTSVDEKQEILDDITERFLTRRPMKFPFLPKSVSKTLDNYWLFGGYIVTKVIYIFDVVLLMNFTDSVLGRDRMSNVMDILSQLRMNGTWSESPYFPLVTLCDFPMRTLNQMQHHTIQCTLPLNFYHERMFVFLWVWFAALFCLSLISLIYWVIWTIIVLVFKRQSLKKSNNNNNNLAFINDKGNLPEDREKSEELLLKVDNHLVHNHDVVDKKFMMKNYDNVNAIFIYEMIKSNVGLFTSRAFAEKLVRRLKEQQKARENANSENHLIDSKPT